MKLLAPLLALALVLSSAGPAMAAPTAPPVAASPAASIVEALTSDPVPITVDGVDLAELQRRDAVPAVPTEGAAVEATGSAAERFEACAVREFTDVPPGHAFHQYVRWMACEQLTVGYTDGSYGVSRNMSRGETAIFLYRLSGETHDPGRTRDFTDVPLTSSAFTAVSWMKEKGYTHGYSDGSFGRTQGISRGELAAFLYRMSGRSYAVTDYSPYSDMHRTSTFFADAAWLHSTGIITGYADRSFRPGRAVTRGEASKFIFTFDQVRRGTLPEPTEDRWTTVATPLHATADPWTEHGSVLPAQTGVTRVSEQGTMTRVRTDTTTGWVNTDFLSKGRPGTREKPYPTPLEYTQYAANTIAPWCWDIPMAQTFDGAHAWAQYTVTGDPRWPSTYAVEELIGLGHDLPADSTPARAVQLHECAHILQYRTYRYDKNALRSNMARMYPGGTAEGVEHMADCMADAMGARRVSSANGTRWVVGYGGTCTSAQMAAARKVIAGVRP